VPHFFVFCYKRWFLTHSKLARRSIYQPALTATCVLYGLAFWLFVAVPNSLADGEWLQSTSTKSFSMKTHRSIHTAARKYLKHQIYSKFVQLLSIETCWRSDREIDAISPIGMKFMHAKQRTFINIGKIVGAVNLLTCSYLCKVLGLNLQARDNIVWYTVRDSSLRFYFEMF